ncbi:MAG: hypothetical protein JXA15_08975 [Spirochaetales bacterium]|nr:hypothetical protein [Spirochaetales bacterium]
MEFEREYRERCAKRALDEAATDAALRTVEVFAATLGEAGSSLAAASLAELERALAVRVAGGWGAAELVAVARWYMVAGLDAISIRLLAYLLPIGVLPDHAKRLETLHGAEVQRRVMELVRIPPEGAPPEAYPAATAAFVKALEAELGPEKARRVLAWNVHGIPAGAHAEERERFLTAPSIAAWLAGWHERQVAELQRFADSGELWYEQRITQDVVDWVRENPEIQGGVVEGNRIFRQKIPYDPDRFLRSTDPLERRRLACHCPLAAASITETEAEVPAAWCACSSGYDKFPFDVVFGVETEVEVLESVLAGDGRCRFAITIPESVLALKPAV